MFDKAIQKAIENFEKTVSNKKALGREVGGILATLALAPVGMMIFNRISGTKKKDIHHDEDHGVNTDGKGKLVAAVYQGDDGKFYKRTADRWYSWDGKDWV